MKKQLHWMTCTNHGLILNNFIAESDTSLQLTDSEYNDFRGVIYRCYYSNYFNSNNVVLTDGRITGITILNFDSNERRLKVINSDAPKKILNSNYLSENEYLNPEITINAKPIPVDLNKKMQVLSKILQK